jgi:hypothetical protein
LKTWVHAGEPAPDPIKEMLNRKMRELEEGFLRDGMPDWAKAPYRDFGIQDEVILDDPLPRAQPWWQIHDYEKDGKTKELMKVYAQGRARNKPLKHWP